jgi:hypothetical protein
MSMKIHLQSIGEVPAIPASEIKEGDVRMYNFGSTELVLKVIEKSEKTLTVISYNSGKYFIYDIRKTTPVAIVKRDQDVSIHKPTHAAKVRGRNKGMVDVSGYFKDEQLFQETNTATKTNNTKQTETQPQKVKLKLITFLWSESNIIKDNTIVNTWGEANNIIKDIAFSIENEGYRKTSFFIEWEDGRTYRGRIDVMAKDWNKNAPLSEHVENFALFMAGLKKPAVYTQEEYENLLNAYKSDREAWKEFLISYMLYDEALTKTKGDNIPIFNNSTETNELNQEENKIHEKDILQEEAEKINNTLANESPEDLQADNIHNSDQVQTLQISYKINHEKNGIELYFSDKPNEAIREQLKRMGFKWSKRGFWYAKKTDERLQFVLSLLSDSYNSELTEEQRKTLEKRLQKENVKPLRLFKSKNTFNVLLECLNTNLNDPQPFYFLIRSNGEEIGKGYDSDILNDYELIYTYTHNSDQENKPNYPDINIYDIESYVIDKKLSEAENAGHWIFRTKEREHTKEIQNFFASYNNKVIELLEQTDNERIKYYLKKSLQSFKKRYFENYVKRLRNKANNPSWVVTGRGGLNVRKYNKALNQYDRLMQESIEITKQMDRTIERAKDEIRRDKEQRIKETVKSVKNDLTFTTVTKEIEYMGLKERKRIYVYGNYWTAKLWGSYKVFKDNQELYALKTTQGLEDAKRYIAYLVQQEKQENAITA